MAGAVAGSDPAAIVSADVTGPVRALQQARSQALRVERQVAGVSQRVVAEFAGIDRENLANIEAGRRPFSAETEARIREAIRQAASSGIECRKPGRPRRQAQAP